MRAEVPPVPLTALVYALKKVLDIDIDPNASDAKMTAARYLETILEQEGMIEQLLDHLEIYEEAHPDSKGERPSDNAYKWSTDLVRPPTGYEDLLFDSPPTGSTRTQEKSKQK